MSEKELKLLTNIFDPDWYLLRYQDVANAGIDPFAHYIDFGRKEGRWPCHIDAVAMDDEMWADGDVSGAYKGLKLIATDGSSRFRGLASWFLCRWLASWHRWEEARIYVETMLNDPNLSLWITHEGPFLLAFSVLYKCNERPKALALINNSQWTSSANKVLATSMLKNNREKIQTLNQIYSTNNLVEIDGTLPSIDTLQAKGIIPKLETRFRDPLVSVIIPCFNAAGTIQTAVHSLLNQTYTKLEIILVDDASTDNSESAIKSLIKSDKRVKYIRQPENNGAYMARNQGLKACKGSLITVHDADDWSHPQKIEHQVQFLKKHRKVKAVTSHWVRSNHKLEFESWRMEEGWIYRNVSSLMFRRSVYRKLGFWDNVSVNADTEYYLRIQKKFGAAAIGEVLPHVPLSIGRVDSSSLTQNSITHLRTQFAGVRKDYLDSAIGWHRKSKRLFMPQFGIRKFISPPLICRGEHKVRLDNLKKVLDSKQLFDANWYITVNQDVKLANVDPLSHFIQFGIDEGRDPNPVLSLTGLAYINDEQYFEAISRWATDSMSSNAPDSPDDTFFVSINGEQQLLGYNSVLAVAHLAGQELYGAERSFIDCLRMLHRKQNDIHVILPSGINRSYINEVKKYAVKIFFCPLPWWQKGRREFTEITEHIRSIIKCSGTNIMYVNTLTLWEPIIAARKSGLKTIMHVRELPNHDPELCKRLNATPDEIRKHVISNNDHFIANSQATASFLNLKNKTNVVYNSIDTNRFLSDDHASQSEKLNVVMVSSNTVKKGIDDLFEVARLAGLHSENINFYIYGPESADLTQRLVESDLTNITYCGYADEPQLAYADKDVVLNLSHFQESFGRTIVEGMCCGCVPIAYDWGALSEVVETTVGYLVPFKDYKRVADILLKLSNDQIELSKLKHKTRINALARFSEKEISDQLSALLKVSQ